MLPWLPRRARLAGRSFVGWFFLLDKVAINRCCQRRSLGCELPREWSREKGRVFVTSLGTAAELRLVSVLLLCCSGY